MTEVQTCALPIYVLGSKDVPIFEAEGKNGRIKNATLHVGFTSSIIVFRKDAEKDSYVLNLFLSGKKGEISSLFDLNMDGKWDVKMLPLKPKKYILVENKWVEINKIVGLRSKNPTATNGRKKFVFKEKWLSM